MKIRNIHELNFLYGSMLISWRSAQCTSLLSHTFIQIQYYSNIGSYWTLWLFHVASETNCVAQHLLVALYELCAYISFYSSFALSFTFIWYKNQFVFQSMTMCSHDRFGVRNCIDKQLIQYYQLDEMSAVQMWVPYRGSCGQ